LRVSKHARRRVVLNGSVPFSGGQEAIIVVIEHAEERISGTAEADVRGLELSARSVTFEDLVITDFGEVFKGGLS